MRRRRLLSALLMLSAASALPVAAGPARRAARPPPGRRASPNSVAGARRRTTVRRRRRYRRRVYRGLRLSYLPYGCRTTRDRRGTRYYYCRGVWYRPVYSGTTIVYVVDDIDSGADTNVEFDDDAWEG